MHFTLCRLVDFPAERQYTGLGWQMIMIRNLSISVRIINRCMAFILFIPTTMKIEGLNSSVAIFQKVGCNGWVGLSGKTIMMDCSTSTVEMVLLLVSIQNIQMNRMTEYSHLNAQDYIETIGNSHNIFMAFVLDVIH